ncbi:hypothetical protein C8Q74DRAFT_870014 [Fomes fomentarius]|nr:hypothetical protein C8Q74DRAFT_870014 [Fomes fomentarius]
MPKVRRSSTLAYLPVRRPLIARLPRRMSAEDAEEQYRREKFGIPGPIDTFLAAQMARGVCCSPGKVSNTDADTSDFSQDEDEVHCTVSVQRIKAPDDSDSIFMDPDTFVLHLTATTTTTATAPPPTPPRTPRATDTTAAASVSWHPSRSQTPSQRQQQQSSEPGPGVRQVILGRYEGHPESLDAPEWTRLLPVGKPIVFRASAAAVAELLVHARAALWKDAMAVSSLLFVLLVSGERWLT